jgi:curved DNA-binding protein CbpA
MNWYRFATRFQMTYEQALRVFGYPSGSKPNQEDVKKKYRSLSRKLHPDAGGTQEGFASLSNAYEVLQSGGSIGADPFGGNQPPRGAGKSWYEQQRQRGPEDVPPWQTDARSSYNGVNENLKFRDINYCKREIYSYSLKNGDVSDYLVSAFDGAFFRGTFTVKTNEASLGFVGEVMEKWNSLGANPYPTEAVVAARGYSDRWKVIRIKGQDSSGRNIWVEMSDSGVPWNSRQATEQLRRILGEG